MNLELGKGSPTLDTIVRVAATLGLDPSELIRGLRPN
jgi:DNA-binding phage protein